MDFAPNRCASGGVAAYDKSVAVLANSDFVGYHVHGACREGTKRKVYFNQSEAAILHFVDLWISRAVRKALDPMCQQRNEFTAFMESGIEFDLGGRKKLPTVSTA